MSAVEEFSAFIPSVGFEPRGPSGRGVQQGTTNRARGIAEMVLIGSLEEAIAWGDSCLEAYREERRERLREARRLNNRIFDLEHAFATAENEILVLKICVTRGWPLACAPTGDNVADLEAEHV